MLADVAEVVFIGVILCLRSDGQAQDNSPYESYSCHCGESCDFCTAKVLLIVNIGVSKNSNMVEKFASDSVVKHFADHCVIFLYQFDEVMSFLITNFVVTNFKRLSTR